MIGWIGWLRVIDHRLDLEGRPLSGWVNASSVVAAQADPLGGTWLTLTSATRFQVDETPDVVLSAIAAGNGDLHLTAPPPLPERAQPTGPIVIPLSSLFPRPQRCDDPNCPSCNPPSQGPTNG